jgi:hypothetical protein
MLQSPEVQARIAQLRARANDNTITDDEYREAIALLRADRTSAIYNGEKKASRAKTKAAIPDALDMLSELEGL